MQQFDGNIFKLISAWPMWIQVFIVLLIILLVFGGWRGIKPLIKLFKRDHTTTTKRIVNITSKNDLVNHPIFGKMEHFLDHEIRMLNFGDAQRNKLFRIILEKQIEEYSMSLYYLATHTMLEKLTEAELRNLVFDKYNGIVNNYNSKIKDAIGTELFELIMNNETKGYNAWHEPVLQMVQSGIEDVLDSDMYHNNYEKVYFVLDRYKNSLKAIKMNVENAYRNFNGDLDKVLKKSNF